MSDEDIGKPRANACIDKLRELNEQVSVDLLEGPLTLDEAGLKQFQVVVMVNKSREELLEAGLGLLYLDCFPIFVF